MNQCLNYLKRKGNNTNESFEGKTQMEVAQEVEYLKPKYQDWRKRL